MRAFRFEVLNEPKPGQATLSPFIADETTRSKNSEIVRSASAFDTPAFCDTASINSALVISLPCFPGYGLPLNIYLSRFEKKLQAPTAISNFCRHSIQKSFRAQNFSKNYLLTQKNSSPTKISSRHVRCGSQLTRLRQTHTPYGFYRFMSTMSPTNYFSNCLWINLSARFLVVPRRRPGTHQKIRRTRYFFGFKKKF